MLSFTARIEGAHSDRAASASKKDGLTVPSHPSEATRCANTFVNQWLVQACSFSLQGWGLIDLPLRASNEGLLRPRVARAQKIISLHPLLRGGSVSTGDQPGHPPLATASIP